MNQEHILQSLKPRMELRVFQGLYPEVDITAGKESDYDPDLWNKTVQFQKYAAAKETIHGIGFDIYMTFFKEQLSFIQYFGRPGSGEASYAAAGRAFDMLESAICSMLGAPDQRVKLKPYGDFIREERPTSGHPDDRWVEAASSGWGRGWIHLTEYSGGSLILELRMDFGE